VNQRKVYDFFSEKELATNVRWFWPKPEIWLRGWTRLVFDDTMVSLDGCKSGGEMWFWGDDANKEMGKINEPCILIVLGTSGRFALVNDDHVVTFLSTWNCR
jgi:hypothetical protein